MSFHERHFDLSQVLYLGSQPLTPALADLADIAIAIYLADRLCRRDRKAAEALSWSRHIELQVAVRMPEFWKDPSVRTALTEAIEFYTGDEWNFSFVPEASLRLPTYAQGELFNTAKTADRAALFSGGLDSLAGACCELVERDDEKIMLVGGSTGPRMRAVQQKVALALAGRFGGRVIPTVIKFGFRNRLPRADRTDENTQRARGFVFAALGAIASITLGIRELAIYENGVGSVNLPFTPGQVGVHLTRATNPIALRRMEALIKAVTGAPFHYRLPFLFKTKGTLCAAVREAGLKHLVELTISCDGFPQRVPQQPQCGLCTSCLLRRVSLHAAGLTPFDAHNYRVDVLKPDWVAQAGAEKQAPFRAMVYQRELLARALASSNPWHGLAARFPELLEIVWSGAAGSSDIATRRFTDLYRAYCVEWQQFPARPTGYEAALAA
jgi:7-cyano-7-deazaguanine synthase in queuosine biosynthesis